MFIHIKATPRVPHSPFACGSKMRCPAGRACSHLLLGQPVVSSTTLGRNGVSRSLPQSQCVFYCSITHPVPPCSAGGHPGGWGSSGAKHHALWCCEKGKEEPG